MAGSLVALSNVLASSSREGEFTQPRASHFDQLSTVRLRIQTTRRPITRWHGSSGTPLRTRSGRFGRDRAGRGGPGGCAPVAARRLDLFEEIAHFIKGWASSQDSLVGLTMVKDVPPYCPVAQHGLPISRQPRQKQTEGGTAKSKVNPTILPNQMPLPVLQGRIVDQKNSIYSIDKYSNEYIKCGHSTFK